MPYGAYPILKELHSSARPNGSSLVTRLRTRLRRSRLDRQLADGVDPALSAELTLRAKQLHLSTERARIANGLVEAVGDARRREPVTLQVRPQRAAVREAADDIVALAARLREDGSMSTAAVATAAWLADNKTSPVYRDDGGDLREAIRFAQDGTSSEVLPLSIEVAARAA
jgi:hypothetical protein